MEKNNKLTNDLEEIISELEQAKYNNHKQIEENNLLKEQIDALIDTQVETEKKMQKIIKSSTLTDLKIEPKIYLKGMFDCFIPGENVLKILIEGSIYYYALKDYQCAHLPMSGSRILIFQSSEADALIYGFDISKLLPPAKNVKVEIKSILQNTNRVKLYSKKMGYFDVDSNEEFLHSSNVKIGDELILKQIRINGSEYLCLDSEVKNIYPREHILETLLRAAL
jgi:hypothetical protein